MVSRLRQAILAAEFRPGEKLVSAQLEERFGVSQTPVREALQRLGSEGLVELSAQYGARVAPVSTRDMLEIYEVRMMLEPIAISRSLRASDAAYHSGLQETFGELSAVLRRKEADLWEFERHHRAFHHALVAACDSRWILRMVSQLMDHSVRYRLLSWTPRGGPADILREHEGLFAAAEAGDVDSASALTYRHLRHTVDLVYDTLAVPANGSPLAPVVPLRQYEPEPPAP